MLGVHGRPSMRTVVSQMKSEDVILLVKRTLKDKEGNVRKSYFREYLPGFEGKDDYTKVSLDKYKDIDDAVIVRWGSRFPIESGDSTIIYNESRAINRATNKGDTRVVLAREGVSVPEIYTPSSDLSKIGYPVVARPQQHSKGKNLVLIPNESMLKAHMDKNFDKGWYYARCVHKHSEFRIHVALGKILAVMEKPNPQDGKVAWNRAQNAEGDGFEYVNWSELDNESRPYLKNACRQAIAAVEALGLSTGGVDVICEGDNAYVLEVNTCPTLNSSPYVSGRWAMFFDFLFGQETRRKPFPWREKEKASSLIWKNSQLRRETETPEID